MAESAPQEVDPAAASSSSSNPPKTTISTEEEELALESGIPAAPNAPNGSETDVAEAVDMKPEQVNEQVDGVQGDEGGPEDQEEDMGEKKEEVEEEKMDDPNALPAGACETLYLQNLNEKVRIPVMTQTLASLFKPYRPLLPVTAHRNLRMRGQAFVTFADVDMANKARKEVAEFPLYGKAIQISFARGRSDVAVKKFESDEAFEQHVSERKKDKGKKRRNNALRRKAQQKLKADETVAPAAKRQRLQMPDEYLPPNSVLFIQNLPEGTTSDDLRDLFELHPGLVEIRTIPAKKDIAFIEYADETSATVAKETLHNFKIDGETKMKVTYARK